LTLLRLGEAQPAAAAPDYPTTLEEVVLGYLASGRALPSQGAGEAAA
jgi:hypothetical protein